MDINAVADEVLNYLNTKHTRIYRNNKISEKPTFPYIVYSVESIADSYPSYSLFVSIDIYDDKDASVVTIEDLADLIDGDSHPLYPTGLNNKIINTNTLNVFFDRQTRQYVKPTELVSAQLIDLRYTVRAYFK